MKKNIFAALGIFSLLIAGAASFAFKQEVKQAKADGDPVAVTLNFHSFNAGNVNIIDIQCTPENDIPIGWDVAPIVQVSRDAFWINGVPTQDDGNCVIQKITAYRYQICIDSIKWSKYNNFIQPDDTVLVQGKWESVYEDTTYDVTFTPVHFKWTGTEWTRLETYDINLNLSINQSRKDDKNQLYLTPTAENPIAPKSDWSMRMDSSANECLMVNGVAASHSSQLMKLLEFLYLVYLPDAGLTIDTNDVVKVQGIYVYNTPLLAFHVHVTTISVKWTGTEWTLANAIEALDNSSADQLEAGSLLANIGRTRPDTHASSIKNFDQKITWDDVLGEEVSTLVYKKDQNNHTGVYFTSSTGGDGEFRVYFPGNGYKTESKGYAMTQLTFDYIYKNNNVVGANNRNPSLTEDGYYVPTATDVDNNFTVQALLHNNAINMYFDIEVELINDGELHSVTLNLAYGDVMGFGFKVWDFNGTFFMSNVHANYQEYNANLDAMYGLLKMYDSENDVNYTSCEDYYSNAKAGYIALSDGEKTLFNTNAAYASARARLAAWATANGETFDAVNGTFSSISNMMPFGNDTNRDTILIVILVASGSMILLGAFFMLNKKRKQK